MKVKKDKIVLYKSLPKAEVKCFSVLVTADTVYGGYSDGSIRKFNLKTNNCDLHIKSTERDEDFVWCLKLVDEYIFSGSSSGQLKVWDTKHGTLVKTFN